VETFEEVIARSPDYDQALNYLGYMLADRGERLEYAHRLIERAVTISPDNAAYLDSYGWVLYRLGNYDQALVHLQKAVTLGDDSVIFDHLGDVYQAVGDAQQARTWWERALEMDPDNNQIKEKLSH
jgi:tetratricopeptide (TPR) repeat protein